VQGLVDPAVVIITMIVPSLQFEGMEEAFHQSPPFFGSGGRSSTILHPSAAAAATRSRPAASSSRFAKASTPAGDAIRSAARAEI
jgi:hypothetical protein